MRYIVIFLIFACLSAASVRAGELNFGKMTTSQLEDIYKFYGYEGTRGYLMLPTYHYPKIYLQQFPVDFAQLDDERRIALFIKVLAPLGMKINDEILAEREKLLSVITAFRKNNELDAEQTAYVERLAKEYDVFTRLQGYQRYKHLLGELFIKVDEVPVSLLIGVAAIETDWGKNRLVAEGNSLYRQLIWHSDEGMTPQDETEESDYKIKSYSSLYASMKEFANKLNSHVNFYQMRDFRKRLRRQKSLIAGAWFAPKLLTNSPLKNYAGLLEYTVAFYELVIIDKSILGDEMTEKPLPDNLSNLLTKK